MHHTEATSRGPESGSLVLLGGGFQVAEIYERIVNLAGGADAPIVVIPTARGGENFDRHWEGLNHFRAAGATDIRILHTRNREEADTTAYITPLLDAKGVWLTGGAPLRVLDVCRETRTHNAIQDVLDRGLASSPVDQSGPSISLRTS